MKKSVIKLISLLLILSIFVPLLFVTSNISFAEEKKNFLVMGDSIAKGYGVQETESYAKLYEKYLNLKNRNLELKNYSISGIDSFHLFGQLNEASVIGTVYGNVYGSVYSSVYSSVYPIELYESIKNSDIISISIGMQDFMNTFFKDAYDIDNNETTSLNSEPLMNDLANNTENTQDIVKDLNHNLDIFSNNFKGIISIIKNIAPEAQIIVNNLYNPFEPSDLFYSVANEFVTKFNSVIDSDKHKYYIADVSKAFSNRNDVVDFDLLNFKFNFNPTKEGHYEICEAMIESEANEQLVFNDIENHWASNYIKWLTRRKILKGYEDNSFRPSQHITRAEAVAILARAFNLKPLQYPIFYFNDSQSIPEWIKMHLGAALEEGIIKGYEDNTIKINNNITRAEMIVMIMRALKTDLNNVKKPGFTDDENIPEWAYSSVAKAKELGIINGYSDGSFGAKLKITRAELAKIVYYILSK